MPQAHNLTLYLKGATVAGASAIARIGIFHRKSSDPMFASMTRRARWLVIRAGRKEKGTGREAKAVDHTNDHQLMRPQRKTHTRGCGRVNFNIRAKFTRVFCSNREKTPSCSSDWRFTLKVQGVGKGFRNCEICTQQEETHITRVMHKVKRIKGESAKLVEQEQEHA